MFFDEVEEGEPDPIFGLNGAFIADKRDKKVNLLAGIYKDENLRSEIFQCAKRAKEEIFTQDLAANYLPIDGHKEMVELLGPILFGQIWEKEREKIYGAHTTGGTGALRIGAEFLNQFVSKKVVLPNYTWPNHQSIFQKANFQIEYYPYFSQERRGFDLEKTISTLKKLPEKTVLLLHGCCHNPTGCDPTIDEWKRISTVIRDQKLFPFFDFAYQGLGEGIEKDAEAIRLFLNEGHEMAIAYSCSKNFSMYCQRVGALFTIGSNNTVKRRIEGQVQKTIRALYSNPPAHGAYIVAQILKKEELHKLWLKDLDAVRNRINLMRETFVQRLVAKGEEMNFEELKKHKGMFSFMKLKKKQVQMLIDQFGIYVTESGRINISGLTSKNIEYVVNSIVSISKKG